MSLSCPRRHNNLIRYNIVSHVSVDLDLDALGENVWCAIHYVRCLSKQDLSLCLDLWSLLTCRIKQSRTPPAAHPIPSSPISPISHKTKTQQIAHQLPFFFVATPHQHETSWWSSSFSQHFLYPPLVCTHTIATNLLLVTPGASRSANAFANGRRRVPLWMAVIATNTGALDLLEKPGARQKTSALFPGRRIAMVFVEHSLNSWPILQSPKRRIRRRPL